MLAVDVVPRAPDEEGDVVGEVEDRGDEGQAEKEEEDGVEGELLPGGEHVYGKGQLKVVLLELEPFLDAA